METWLPRRPVVLDEILRRDGLQEHMSLPQCVSCLEELGRYKCIDCTVSPLYCASCIVCQHENAPLHRLEVRPRSPSGNPFSCLVRFGMVAFLRGRPSTT